MAIIGSILGDIAGSQYEFPITRPTRLDWRYCNLFTDRCKFTDDTVMTLAVKFAIKNNKSFGEVYRNLGRKYQEVGYGEKFRDWLSRDDDKAYYSFGNGAAMRCSYIGEYFDSENEVEEWAIKSAECTHIHPEGIKGAITTAMCVYMARTGATKDEIFQYVKLQYPLENYKYSIERQIADYRNSYHWNASCQGSVPAAIRCFLESDCYESFLRNVFSLRCDMDTLCAIGGGIAEEFYNGTGFDNENLLKKYLDNYLYKIVLE